MKLSLLSILALALTACASAPGVVPTGNGTYMVSKSEWGIQHTGSSVKVNAIKEANAYCIGLKKEIEVLKTSQNDMVPFKSEAQAEVEFRCR